MIALDKVLNNKTALFFIDEIKDIPSMDSKGNDVKCTLIGLLCVQGDQFLKLEEDFLKYRIENRLWGEVHFVSASGSYVDKYSVLLREYISNSFVTFHSRMFANVEKGTRKNIHGGLINYDDIFKEEAYRLVRSVIMKCIAYGIERFYILADGYSKGRNDYRDIKVRLNKDDRIPEIRSDNNLCCTTGDSCCCGALQICDLLVSTLGQYKFKKDGLKKDCIKLLNTIFEANDEIDPMIQKNIFPTLYSSKFHYYTVFGYKGIGAHKV